MTVGAAMARQDDGRTIAHKKAAIPRPNRGNGGKRFPKGQPSGYAPLLPGAADDFLAGSRPSPAVPGGELQRALVVIDKKPAQVVAAPPVIRAGLGAGIAVVTGTDHHVADQRIALSPASGFGLGFRPLLPVSRRGESCPWDIPGRSFAPGFGILLDISNQIVPG